MSDRIARRGVIIIGGGPAGLAAAVRLHDLGVNDVLIVEREHRLGGILRQCIHDGFGLTRFKRSLSGPEYAQRFIDDVDDRGIDYLTDATVIDVTADRIVTLVCTAGVMRYGADAIVLAMGCRERTRHALSIPGTRPAGIYTAGVAQTYVNLQNTMPGREAVILGSGDIGMIMARRLTLEGAHVSTVLEILPYASGLPRNVEQCLNDYGISLRLSHTVVEILGDARLEAVKIARVDDRLKPIAGTEEICPCDTLILSVGLIPENELSLGAGVRLDPRTRGPLVDETYQTSVEGVFAAGNVLHVHDLVDFVSMEAERLAKAVVIFLDARKKDHSDRGRRDSVGIIPIIAGSEICYTVPQAVGGHSDFTLSVRARQPLRDCTLSLRTERGCVHRIHFAKMLPAKMVQIAVRAEWIEGAHELHVELSGALSRRMMKSFAPGENQLGPDTEPLQAKPGDASPEGDEVRMLSCIMCPTGCDMRVKVRLNRVVSVSGNSCKRGEQYASSEVSAPVRNIATSVSVEGGELPVVSVRLDKPIPKNKISDVMARIAKLKCTAPVEIGEVLLADVCGTASNVIATKRLAGCQLKKG
ncbi:protein of unknown function DUF1667 [Coriobacterium glomerans PW2]|uniref:FAD/NAD(P)-binding domain-containing protein n=1 Tax=Coriobacterium glomerans (strain ATCC 49209 / DSM 20642 / JCM 10262 / PW2) TaxID=700015 RepID=F2N8Q7_CORGP|nr:FAD-dependent oxidoreductase [Coriobacterium glomerans]AEB07440.1 protein of unknown function DUF1667 [Coriobacterium glomerans PW2]